MSKKPKLLILTRYNQKGASSRLRFLNFNDRLKRDSFETTYQCLLPDQYLEKVYANKLRSKILLLKVYLQRIFFLLLNSNKYELVWVEKELFPGFPTFIDLWFLKRFKKLIMDYDDSVYLNYRKAGFFTANKIEKLMALGDVVFAGSPHLEEVAQKAGANLVVRVPTPVEPQRLNHQKNTPFCIGWIGSPASETYLLDLYEVVKKWGDPSVIQWIFLGVKSCKWNDLKNVRCVDWIPENEKKVLQQMDFGIMPLKSSDWEKGKCSYKILLYNSWGIPALASIVGMNTEVVQDGENGFLVENDWDQAIRELLEISSDQYKHLSQKAYQSAKEKYSYEVVYEKIKENLNDLLLDRQCAES